MSDPKWSVIIEAGRGAERRYFRLEKDQSGKEKLSPVSEAVGRKAVAAADRSKRELVRALSRSLEIRKEFK